MIKIIRKFTLMLASSIIALVLHPLLYIIGIEFYTDNPFIIFHFLIIYTIIGTFIWKVCEKIALWKLALIMFVGINFCLAIILFFWMSDAVNDGMTGLMILWESFWDCCLSIIPIALCCYLNSKYWEPTRP